MIKIIDRIKSKLKDKNGETIAETLVALLITVLALMLLPGAIVAASRVNNRVEKQTTYVDYTKGQIVTGTLTINTGGIGTSGTITVSPTIKKYTKEGKSIYYYE